MVLETDKHPAALKVMKRLNWEIQTSSIVINFMPIFRMMFVLQPVVQFKLFITWKNQDLGIFWWKPSLWPLMSLNLKLNKSRLLLIPRNVNHLQLIWKCSLQTGIEIRYTRQKADKEQIFALFHLNYILYYDILQKVINVVNLLVNIWNKIFSSIKINLVIIWVLSRKSIIRIFTIFRNFTQINWNQECI